MGLSVVPEFRAVFIFAVGDLLFLTGAGNCLGIRSAKVRPLLFSLPGFQDKGSIADVRQLDFLIPQNAALERLIAVCIEFVGVVQLNLRFAILSPCHPAISHGDVVPGFQTGYTGFEISKIKHERPPPKRLRLFLPQ